jgi:drug/metabolite transporter (DMT)-like permease
MLGTAYHLLHGVADVNALTVVTVRASAGAVILCAWLALTNRGLLRVDIADLPGLIGFGVGSLGPMYLSLFIVFDLTSAAVGTVLLYLAPALVTVGAAIFLNEPLTSRKLIALLLTFGGCLLVVELYRPQTSSATPSASDPGWSPRAPMGSIAWARSRSCVTITR